MTDTRDSLPGTVLFLGLLIREDLERAAEFEDPEAVRGFLGKAGANLALLMERAREAAAADDPEGGGGA